MLVFRSLSSCAVDIFLLIMGYFLCKTNVRTLGKPLGLLLQVVFCNIIVYLFFCFVIPDSTFSIKGLCVKFIPASYFPLLYAVLYFISPYINKCFHSFGKREWNIFLIVILSIFSLYPTMVDFSQEILDMEWFGLNSIAAWGDQQGFNIVNFSLLYCVGAYIRNNDFPEIFKKRKNLIGIIVVLVCLISFWAYINTFFSHHGMRSAWVYHNPFVILLTIAFFLLFNTFTFKSRFVNATSKLCFLCFLIHSRAIFHFNLESLVGQPFLFLMLHYITFVVGMFGISYVANKLYNLCFKQVVKFLDSKSIPYFSI